MTGAQTSLSVVVATRDRPEALERCLVALSRQTAPALEIVVVDDASADAAAVRGAIERSGARARLIRGSGRGPAAARNIGVAAAAGATVCLTDDDCEPAPEWAQRLGAACASGGAAAGVTRADPRHGRTAAAAQLLAHLLQVTSVDSTSGALGFAPTCNMACATVIARRVPFDESFPHAAGEDREWCARLADAGVALRFVPGAVVVHRPGLGLRRLLRQQMRYGRGAVRYRTSVAAHGRGPRRLAGRRFYARLVRESLRAGPQIALIVALAQGAVVAGALAEVVGGSAARHPHE